MNTTILPNDGLYKLETISLETARAFVSDSTFTSAIGHESTAKVLTALLGVEVPMNRTMVSLDVGDQALCFKLLTRLQEGVVLSEQELKELPYEFKLLTRVE